MKQLLIIYLIEHCQYGNVKIGSQFTKQHTITYYGQENDKISNTSAICIEIENMTRVSDYRGAIKKSLRRNLLEQRGRSNSSAVATACRHVRGNSQR